MGRNNVRFRRKHSTEYIRSRLIALDFILRNHDYTYLESEEQKLRYFCDQLGIDKKFLPAKRYSGAIKDTFTDRYFVDKFPMFYSPTAAPPPVVWFSFIDPGFESLDSFKTHVDAYLTLFMKLPKVTLYYVATRDTNFKRAEKYLFSTFDQLWNPDGPHGLLAYFRTRRTWDAKNYGKLTDQDLIFLNEAKARFGSHGIEDLYRRWQAEEIHDQGVRAEYPKFRMPLEVRFISSAVNGQAALFERHPRQPVKGAVKSSAEASFPGDFTPSVTSTWS
jgi:hypothetical protein